MTRSLYQTASPWSDVLQMVLERKELEFELLPASSSALLPTYKDHYIHITDPVTTLDYLEDRHPEPRILPVDPTVKAYMRYIIRHFERQTTADNLQWAKDTFQQQRIPYDPNLSPTLLDFYIAAFDTKQDYFSPWATLKTQYLNKGAACEVFTLNQTETAGGFVYTAPVKLYTAPISPPKKRL